MERKKRDTPKKKKAGLSKTTVGEILKNNRKKIDYGNAEIKGFYIPKDLQIKANDNPMEVDELEGLECTLVKLLYCLEMSRQVKYMGLKEVRKYFDHTETTCGERALKELKKIRDTVNLWGDEHIYLLKIFEAANELKEQADEQNDSLKDTSSLIFN